MGLVGRGTLGNELVTDDGQSGVSPTRLMAATLLIPTVFTALPKRQLPQTTRRQVHPLGSARRLPPSPIPSSALAVNQLSERTHQVTKTQIKLLTSALNELFIRSPTDLIPSF